MITYCEIGEKMAEFEVEGKTYDTESFSQYQKELLQSLSTTKGLINGLIVKNKIFVSEKEKLEKTWKVEVGSKIKDISEKASGLEITLANGSRLSYSKLDEKTAQCFRNLKFLNEQILEQQNQLQVLDTARLSYSKTFYQKIKGAE